MKIKKQELEILESICGNDEIYFMWKMYFRNSSYSKKVKYPVVIWAEATKLIMALKEEQHDKREMFKTWNNGICDSKSIAIMDTTMYMLENGDCYLCNIGREELNALEIIFSDSCEKANINYSFTDRKIGHIRLSVDNNKKKKEEETELADSIITDIETVKKVINGMIAICPNEMQGLCLTRSLITYYYEKNPDKLGSYIRIVEAKMMETLNNKPKNRFDLKCLFNDIQVKSSGILKEAKIILAIMHAMLKEDNIKKSKVSYLDCAIGLLAVLKKGKYWEKKTSTFTYMLRDLFNVDVNKGSVNAWFRRHGNDYTQWNHDISRGENIETRRHRIASDFEKTINEVKAYKLEEIKN